MSTATKLAELQRVCYQLYDDCLGQDARVVTTLPRSHLPDSINAKLREPSICLPFHGTKLRAFDYSVLRFTQEVGQFWTDS